MLSSVKTTEELEFFAEATEKADEREQWTVKRTGHSLNKGTARWEQTSDFLSLG